MLFFVGENGKCEYKDGRKLVLKSVRNSTLFCRERFASKTLTFACSRQNAALWAANFRPVQLICYCHFYKLFIFSAV